jgi:hypothetical protein
LRPKRVVYQPKGVQRVDTGIPFNNEGKPIMSPSFYHADGYNEIQDMKKYQVTSTSVNIFDELIEKEIRLSGGQYWIREEDVNMVSEDDYVEFSIVDKDDVLGLFSVYGVPSGGFIELAKFVRKHYVRKGDKNSGYYSDLASNIEGAALVGQGLYKRMYYYSFGAVPLTMYVNYITYQ